MGAKFWTRIAERPVQSRGRGHPNRRCPQSADFAWQNRLPGKALAVHLSVPPCRSNAAGPNRSLARRSSKGLGARTAHFASVSVTPPTMQSGAQGWRWIIPAGLLRLSEDVEQTVPALQWDTRGGDFAEWISRRQGWGWFWVQTGPIALIATGIGVVGGVSLSFAAFDNPARNTLVPWIGPWHLEIAERGAEFVASHLCLLLPCQAVCRRSSHRALRCRRIPEASFWRR
ncbi:MAG: hypothetical protein AAF281_13260 [Pseudomonadota bacterium]